MAIPTENKARFNMLWRSLDRALSMAGLDNHEQVIMQVARELSYTTSVIDGTGRAKAFRLNLSALAERRDMTRETLSRGLTRLIAGGLLVGERDRLRIGKRYRTWTGKYTLSSKQIIEADNADFEGVCPCGESFEEGDAGENPAPKTRAKKCDSNVTPVTETSHRTNVSSVTETSQKCDSNVTVAVTETSQSHIEERARKTELRQSREEIVVTGAGGTATDAVTCDPDGPGPKPPTTIAELEAWVDIAIPEIEQLSGKLAGWCASYRVEWVHAAILCAQSGAKAGGLASYANKCLLHWHKAGGPPHDEPAERRTLPLPATSGHPPRAAPPRSSPVVERLMADGAARTEFFAERKRQANGPG